MKQFARCTNCRQWYMHSATLLVDVYRGNGLHRTTLWCVSCVRAAEQRSQPAGDSGEHETADPSAALQFNSPALETHGGDDFHRLIQEHLDLMDRALQEDDSVIVPLIDDFMDRCRAHRDQLQQPAHVQRLSGHLHYWETFLQALRRSS